MHNSKVMAFFSFLLLFFFYAHSKTLGGELRSHFSGFTSLNLLKPFS